ncbi:hypothetical protein F8A10_05105 [Paracoccus kondratievae]|uniref:hypothetical protein n=1 Tax=Paracoccus TaxID=265 RepID=UPI000A0D136E|nr:MULTISPECIES: hypothetical protein [Paracoccus]QFQ86859.1 hypothetical protein F8A10_05105 [Paracoccus kondratievae]SMG29955.1 hypothetical protein SAMN02746000_01754 [Paracoccus sp. J56]
MTRPLRRRVLYIPGYDPIPPRRYRELYKREGTEQARISGYELGFGARRDRKNFGWGVTGQFGDQRIETEFEVLVWADIVQGSMGQGILTTYGQLLRTAWAYIGSGALFRLMRLRRGPVIAALYPVVVLLVQLLVSVLAGVLVGWGLGHLTTLGWWLGLPVALALTWGGLHLWRRFDGKIFAWYLMHDYAFTAQNQGAYPPALEKRITRFADRIAEVLADDWDEVLVIGHSSGAYLGISVLADLIRSGRVPKGGPQLSYLSLGHVVPMASFLPRANRLRADLRYLSARDELDWIDVTAPGDACSFGLCDPVSVSGVEPADRRHPLILSAAFAQTLSPEKRRELRGRWFRLHFQYLCSFDRPGDYDYFAITAGPLTLAQRFAGRGHSPGRIARAVNRWTKT